MLEGLQRRPFVAVAAAAVAAVSLFAAPPRIPKEPATISIDVEPSAIAAGGSARVTLRLEAKQGIKIARYPQIKLQVPAQEGLVGETETRIGNSKPPPPDKLSTNYWGEVDPVNLTLELDEAAAAGSHEIDAKLTYFFCVSGDFCAPARVPIKIPLSVE